MAYINGNKASNTTESVIIVDAGVTLKLNSCAIITNNRAVNGGAVTLNGTLIMNGGTISGNEAIANGVDTGLGGAIYACEFARFVMNDGVIINNFATSGGAIYLGSGATVSLLGGTVGKSGQGNTATNGGALYVHEAAGGINLNGGAISSNTAELGGGIYSERGLVLEGISIKDNFASSYGGGIYSNKELTIMSGVIDGNKATLNGGGIYVTNTILNIPNIVLSNNEALRGGAI